MILPPQSFHRDSRRQTYCLVCYLVGLLFTARAQSDSMDTFGGDPDKSSFIWIPSNTDDWTSHFHIGAVVGLNISASFSMNGQFNISGNNPVAGTYDDGYVHPGNNAFGQTSLWGYDSASQYNPNGGSGGIGTLAMHSLTSFITAGNSKDDGGPFPGFDMAYGDNLWYWKHARVGWELGFGLLPITIKDQSPMSATVNQSTYTFDTGGIVVPEAPYRGVTVGGQAPTISDTPESITGQTLDNGSVTGTRQLNVMLYTFRFGPFFYWDINDYFGFAFGAGPALGIVSGNYQYNEIISAGGVSARNSGEFSAIDLTFGGYVNGTVLYHIINDADFYLSAQYMPLGSASFSSAGREGQLNLGGQVYVSAGINWPF
jgi:hypothetical protein